MEKYYGNYLGIVVHSADPEKRGRVKIFVPHISATIYEKWNANPEDKLFKTLGTNTDSKVQPILEELVTVLPWAEIAAPLIGAGSAGRYASTDSCQQTTSGNVSGVDPGNVYIPDGNNNPATYNSSLGVWQQYDPNTGTFVTVPGPGETSSLSSGTDLPINDITSKNNVNVPDRTVPPDTAVWHYTESPQTGPASEIDGLINSNNERGFGAQYYITSDGTIWQLYADNKAAQAAAGYNNRSLNVEIVTPDGSHVTQAQLNSALQLSNRFSSQGITNNYAHHEIDPKTDRYPGDGSLPANAQGEGQVIVNAIRNGDTSTPITANQNTPLYNAVLNCQPPGTTTIADGNQKLPPLESTTDLSSLGLKTNEYGPGIGEFTNATLNGPLGALQFGDVALSPDVASSLGLKYGDYFNYNGNMYRYADGSFLKHDPITNTDIPNHNTIEFWIPPGYKSGAGPRGELALGSGPATKDNSNKPALANFNAKPKDGHDDNSANPPALVNPNQNFTRTPYSNVAKGTFSIPAVGSHVWCFFDAGDPMKPVVFAFTYSASDWAGISQQGSGSADSPAYDRSNGGNIHTDKIVTNHRGGSLEFINTEGRESISLVGYHGPTMSLTEDMHFYSPNNHATLVHGNIFTTADHNYSLVTRGPICDINAYGDYFVKVGHLQNAHEAATKIKGLIKPIQDKFMLFNKKRTEGDSIRKSSLQSKAGAHAPCPVCSPGQKYKLRVDLKKDNYNLNKMEVSETADHNSPSERSPILVKGQSKIIEATFGLKGIIMKGKCLACNGTGISPSSELGKFVEDPQKIAAVQESNAIIPQLAKLEADMGVGGSEIHQVTKNHTTIVGMVFNDFESVRADPKGKMVSNAMKVNELGVYNEKTEVPIMEVVPQHKAFPGGRIDVTAMHRYNVLCGSGGMFFRTKGPVQLAGALTNLNSDQIFLTSKNETTITGGKYVSISADNINLAPTGGEQAIIDGGLAVARNAIIAGGLHVEGEVSLHHITAPCEFQITEVESPGGTTGINKLVGWVEIGGTKYDVYGGNKNGGPADPDCVVVDAHHHWFRNLPLTLMETSNDTRLGAANHNKPELVLSKAKYTKDKGGPNFDKSETTVKV